MLGESNETLVSNEVKKYIKRLLSDLSIQDYKIEISPGSVRGDNYLGIVAKVLVEGKNKNGENVGLNLIVKSAPQQDGFRKATPVRIAYLRESYVYKKTLPEFDKFQKEKNVLNPFKSFAKFYNAIEDDKNEAIIMENMKALGYALSNRQEPLDYNHVMLVMREYGKFHALSFAIRDQKPNTFEELAANAYETYFTNTVLTKSYAACLNEWCGNAIKALDPVVDSVAVAKLTNFKKEMFHRAKAAAQSEPAGKYAVINHGDSWMNNMLFRHGDPTDPKIPTDLCFLDWQLARLGSPALDLHYFLFTCTDKDLRDRHFKDFLKEYHNSMSCLLREVGSDPEKLFPFEVLEEHMKKFGAFGMYMAIILTYLMASDSSEIPDVHNGTDENDVMDKFNFSIKNMDKYNKRIRGVILSFMEYGYEF